MNEPFDSSINAEQSAYWNEEAGARWVSEQARLDRLLAPYADAVLGLANALPGERVLDVGCGCGVTTLALARSVGPTGSVTGVDISEPMLGATARAASAAALSNVTTILADAQTGALPQVDLIASRFGVMFFEDPVAAFTNMRSARADGGRLAFVCWQPVKNNPWAYIPGGAVASAISAAGIAMPAPPEPNAPGPFAFGDRDRLHSILGDSGWTGITIDPIEADLDLGADVDDAVHLSLQVGPSARMLAAVDPDTRQRANESLATALRDNQRADGHVRLASACWLVSAS